MVVGGVARDSRPVGEDGNVFDVATRRSLQVIPRETWGADESFRFHDDGTERWREMFVPPKLLVIHHTATPNSYETPEEAMAEIRNIYDFHANGHDWGDIGYHAIVDRFGNIYEGRHGRGGDPGEPAEREILSQAVTGGHTTEYEYGTIGVALLGDATADDWGMWEPAGPMWEALVHYCTFEAGRAGIRPLGADGEAAVTDFLRSDDAWHDGAANVCGHRELQETFCPGDVVIEMLPALRAAIHDGLAGLSRSGASFSIVAPEGREVAPGTPVDLQVAVDEPEPPWAVAGIEYAVEGWFKPVESEDIAYLSGYTDESQPRLTWLPVGPDGSIAFTPERPGHYTVHARPVLRRERQTAPSAWWAQRTYLVRDPSEPERERPSVPEDVGH